MAKDVIFVDIDGVMADSHTWWLDLYNRDHGTNHRREDCTEWDIRMQLGVDLFPYFGNYDGVEPIQGSLTAVGWLKSKYRIVFATAGDGSNWLKKYYSNPEVIRIQDKSLLRGFALIDDNPMNLDGFVGQRFLISQPWNRGRGLNETTWPEVAQYLMKV